jgi:hypothetical protein
MPYCHILLYNIASKYTLKKKNWQGFTIADGNNKCNWTWPHQTNKPVIPNCTQPNIKNLEKFPSAFEGGLLSMKFLVEEDWDYVYSLREGGKLCLLCIGVRSFPLLRSRHKNPLMPVYLCLLVGEGISVCNDCSVTYFDVNGKNKFLPKKNKCKMTFFVTKEY